MQQSIGDFDPPFTILEPVAHLSPVVFNVPHAGRVYPQSFLDSARLGPLALRRSEDAWVDRLFAGVVQLGAPLMVAHFPRAYLDLNREPGELDPRLFREPPPPDANTRSARVAGGLGTIPRVVGDGQEIYSGRISLESGLARVESLYRPYHRALGLLLDRTVARFGCAVLVDCHSMPAPAGGRRGPPPDIVLGDRFGMSCAPALIAFLESGFRRHGYQVVRNRPYAGGFITEHYGAPAIGRHALQVEINRTLYMDDATLAPDEGFDPLARDLTDVCAALLKALPGLVMPLRHAAE